jgi:sulfite reductase beta subunit-like hemoprotein
MDKDRVYTRSSIPISPEQSAEIAMLVDQISRLERRAVDPEDFRKFRLENGIYGIRGIADQHMVRVKVRYGSLTAGQLEALADIAEEFTPNGLAHLTTRQDVQFHFVPRRALPRVLTMLAEAGLTTREACGNTVRNVTACPYAGISPTEVFDVRPYADALSLYFLRNPINQNLPRKFKFAFEGCSDDHARTPIHDFGAVAAVRGSNGSEERGFRIYLGGGLGAQPASARLLEEFTPENLLIPTAEAVLRVFDRSGERREDRAHRMRARLKFLIREWGWEKFRDAVLKERRAVFLTRSGKAAAAIGREPERPPFGKEELERLATELTGSSEEAEAPHRLRLVQPQQAYDRWRDSNVFAQKQEDWYAVTVRAPLGDLSVGSLRHIARTADRFCGGRVQVSIAQNLLLRWVHRSLVRRVYDELDRAGLALTGADTLADITRCPGADTCQIAITHSRGLAEALVPVVESGLGGQPELQRLSIKISGCMNSCGQHHIADLGFYGASEEINGRELPKYVVLLGGRTREGLAEFGVPVAQVPARLVPEAARELLQYYSRNRKENEPFREFADRVGKPAIRALLAKYQSIASGLGVPDLFRDLGVDEEFHVAVGVGECAGGGGAEPQEKEANIAKHDISEAAVGASGLPWERPL